MNNDVLNIISEYADLKLVYNRNKLIVEREKCKACREEIRFTSKSFVPVYLFPEFIEIDDNFLERGDKYIKMSNIVFLANNKYYTYQEALLNNLINYNHFNRDFVFGKHLELLQPVKIYARRAESISNVFYEHIERRRCLPTMLENFKNNMDNQEVLYLLIESFLYDTNIIDLPDRSMEHLCGKCRKKLKKGYIFV